MSTDDVAAAPVVVRLSSLLGRQVIDAEGSFHGHVVDVRVVQAGPAPDGTRARLQVEGLVFGRRGLGARLGLLRHRVHGPWALTSLARLLGHEICFVAWDQLVERPDPDRRAPIRIAAPPPDGYRTLA